MSTIDSEFEETGVPDNSRMFEDEDASQVVIEFSADAPDPLITWLIGLLTKSRSKNGAQCKVYEVSRPSHEKGRMLHIGSDNSEYAIMAEILELRKEYQDGTFKEFRFDEQIQFKHSSYCDSLFTTSEKQQIILYKLTSLRYVHCDIEGTEHLYQGQCIVPHLKNAGTITNLFPLHNQQELNNLKQDWVLSLNLSQPLDEINSYFGSTIAVYFAFLEYYTMMLIIPAVVSIIFFIFPMNHHMQIVMSAFILIWSTVLFECWKRYSSTLEYKWGTLNTMTFEESRPEFYGTMAVNPVTGRNEPYYSKTYRRIRIYFVSLPIVCICLLSAFFIMLFYFEYQFEAQSFHQQNKSTYSLVVSRIPTIAYSIMVIVMNTAYRKLAKMLNDCENHRKQSSYNDHYILKKVLFDSVNSFMSLFYIAFYLRDLKLLHDCLATNLIVSQIVGQINEALIPYLLSKKRESDIESTFRCGNTQQNENIPETVAVQAEIEIKKTPYEAAHEDYLEMFRQYGYVCLFSAVFPTASLWAFFNNITELRTDASKLLYTNRRPFVVKFSNNIKAWQLAFEGLNIMSVITNCTLIGLNIHQSGRIDFSMELHWLFAFIVVEHGLLLLKLVIGYLIPDQPNWIRVAMNKNAFESKRAWIEKKLRINSRKIEKKTT